MPFSLDPKHAGSFAAGLVLSLTTILPALFFPATHDELFTWWASQNSFGELLRIVREDVHPPFYFLCAKLFALVLGDSIHALRVLSGICAAASVLLVGRLYAHQTAQPSESHGLPPGRASTVWWLLAFNGATIAFAHWARMYTFMGLLGVLSADFALRCRQHPDRPFHWAGLTLSAIALCTTHNFAALFAISLYLWLLAETIAAYGVKSRQLGRLLLSGTCCLVVVLPTGLVMVRQSMEVKPEYWITGTGWSGPAIALAGYFGPLMPTQAPEVIRYIGVIMLLILLIPIKLNRFERLFLTQVLCLIGFLAYAEVVAQRPLLVPRYLHTLQPLACLFFLSRIRAVPITQLRHYLYTLFVINTSVSATILLLVGLLGARMENLVAATRSDARQFIAVSDAAGSRWPVVVRHPIDYIKFHYFTGRSIGSAYFWNPEAIQNSRTTHQPYLSAVPPAMQLTNEQIRDLDSRYLLLYDPISTLRLEPPGWRCIPLHEATLIDLPDSLKSTEHLALLRQKRTDKPSSY